MEYRVVIPDEVYAILKWEDEGFPAICVVNQSLAGFEPKIVFGWHLSIIVDCEVLAENGLPTRDELEILRKMEQEFSKDLKADGNGLFLASITWNATRQSLYRIHDPEVANQYLIDIIESESHSRYFDYRMSQDQEWALTKYFLANW